MGRRPKPLQREKEDYGIAFIFHPKEWTGAVNSLVFKYSFGAGIYRSLLYNIREKTEYAVLPIIDFADKVACFDDGFLSWVEFQNWVFSFSHYISFSLNSTDNESQPLFYSLYIDVSICFP